MTTIRYKGRKEPVVYTAPMDHQPKVKPFKPPSEGKRMKEVKRALNPTTKLSQEERLTILVRVGQERGVDYLQQEVELHHSKIAELQAAISECNRIRRMNE
jgi:hypothetical protein